MFSVADLQCDICKKTYSSSSNLNYHIKTQHKQLLLMWKVDGKDLNIPVSSVKKNAIDFERQMNQQIILNKNEIGKEIVNDLIKAAINFSHKLKCETCNSKFTNLDSLNRPMRKFHEPMIEYMLPKMQLCYLCAYDWPIFCRPLNIRSI